MWAVFRRLDASGTLVGRAVWVGRVKKRTRLMSRVRSLSSIPECVGRVAVLVRPDGVDQVELDSASISGVSSVSVSDAGLASTSK